MPFCLQTGSLAEPKRPLLRLVSVHSGSACHHFPGLGQHMKPCSPFYVDAGDSNSILIFPALPTPPPSTLPQSVDKLGKLGY